MDCLSIDGRTYGSSPQIDLLVLYHNKLFCLFACFLSQILKKKTVHLHMNKNHILFYLQHWMLEYNGIKL